MEPLSFLPAVVALFAAVVTTYFIAWQFGSPPDQGRFASIDGLRGYLAFFVFLHHSSIWYFYLRTGTWHVPPSNLYTHFGQSSVALFFMITGFLFFSKLIDGKTKPIDWGNLFVSRFMRLVPLYFFVMFLLFFIVALLSNGSLNEPFPNLIKGAIHWLGFTILDAPNLNGIDTNTIVAGVTWSLPYEWFFYFSLPVLALTVRVVAPLPYMILGLICIACLFMWLPQTHNLLSFLGGIFSSILVRADVFREFSKHNFSGFLALGFIVTAVMVFPTTYELAPLILLSLAFSLIAGGNSLFGVLTNPISRTLGEMAYGIYLLHGIVLFIAFTFLIGRNDAKDFSTIAHWSLVVALTPLLILSSFITFRFIERPAMQRASTVTTWLRLRRRNSKASDSGH